MQSLRGYSTASRNRPAIERLLAEAALKRFDFKSCTELIDTTRPEDRLMFHQFVSFAQYERELIGQETRFGKRLRQGLWNGILPYGYRIVEGKLVAESQEAEWAKQIFRWYLQQNLGVVAISRELKRLGIQPRQGDRWKGTRIYKLINNPPYAGFVRWGGEMAQGTHTPIIDQERFDAAQRTLHQRNHRSRQLRSPNCLSGLVRCRLCGAPMQVINGFISQLSFNLDKCCRSDQEGYSRESPAWSNHTASRGETCRRISFHGASAAADH